MDANTNILLNKDMQEDVVWEQDPPNPDAKPIVTLPNGSEILSKVSRPVEAHEVRDVEKCLRASIYNSWVGDKSCGVAAIQINMAVRMGLVIWEDKDLLLINPEIWDSDGIQIGPEGCMSIPDEVTQVARPNEIVLCNHELVETDGKLDLKSTTLKLSGFIAKIIQHEMDHMDGILCNTKPYIGGKIGRNEKCPCGSDKKFKRCCIDNCKF